MKGSRYLLLLPALFALLLFAAACSGPANEGATQAENGEHTHDDSHTHDDDHSDATRMDDQEMAAMGHTHVAPPAEYADFANPFADDHEAIKAGELIFKQNCIPCHGEEGKGDGPAGEALDPPPRNLADRAMMGMLSDGYLFWRVSKGGAMEPFNSAMVAWERVLSVDERWHVISYVRTLSG